MRDRTTPTTGESAFRPLVAGDRTVPEGDAARRLLQRVGLGPRRDELDAAWAAGFDATLAALMSPLGRDAGVAATPPPALSPPAPDATLLTRVLGADPEPVLGKGRAELPLFAFA